MSFLANALDSFDKAVGIEGLPCEPADSQALALVKAGCELMAPDTEITPDTRLSELADAPTLLQVLKNLEAVYLRNGNLSIGADIIADVTVGEMITHLDATLVNTLIDTMREEERREASNVLHTDLSALDNQIRG